MMVSGNMHDVQEHLFLTKELKEQYNAQYKIICSVEEGFDRIEEGLKKYLDRINENENIAALYSSRGVEGWNKIDTYLNFAFTKHIKKGVVRMLLDLKKKFSNLSIDYNCASPKPYVIQEGTEGETVFKNYWNVNNIRVRLPVDKDFKAFWECLTKHLVGLK